MLSKSKNFKHYHQSKQWEKECIKTRRYLWLRKRRLKMFNISPKDQVLDLGCGDGLNIKLLKLFGVKDIIGVDISRFLIKLAQKNNPDVKFYLASADSLPFKANVFDVVLLDSVFHHLIYFPKVLGEIKRVLKAGGRLCFIDPHKSILRSLLNFMTLSSLSRVIPFLKARKSAYLAEKALIDHWHNNEEVFLDLVEENGFRKIFCKVDIFSTVGMYVKT